MSAIFISVCAAIGMAQDFKFYDATYETGNCKDDLMKYEIKPNHYCHSPQVS
jgi:hypothetical protein